MNRTIQALAIDTCFRRNVHALWNLDMNKVLGIWLCFDARLAAFCMLFERNLGGCVCQIDSK
jgi:hypothetical protein